MVGVGVEDVLDLRQPALAKAYRFVGDPRDRVEKARLKDLSGYHGIWDCTRCYFCNQRCPKGVDPRDAIAKLGAESIKQGIDHDMGAKHAKWFVRSAMTTGWLRETELVPKTQGMVASIKQIKFAMSLAKHGKVPPPPPFPQHVTDSSSTSSSPTRGASACVEVSSSLADSDARQPL